MRPRAEGLSGVDDDRDRSLVRPLPRRSDPESPDSHRSVELLPRLGPAGLDVLRSARPEDLPKALLAARLRIRGELDSPVERNLLEPLREELDQDGPRLLCAIGGDPDRYPAEERLAQRNAALSFSKKPSSGL
jgi:hypothetical protein